MGTLKTMFCRKVWFYPMTIHQSILSLLFIGVIVLAGCIENDGEEILFDQVVNAVQQEATIEKQSSPAIRIMDPYTKKMITAILPEPYQIETAFVEYKQSIEMWVKDLANGSVIQEAYNKELHLDKIDKNGEVIKGSPMVRVKEGELVEQILARSFTGGDIEVPLEMIESGYKKEDVSHLHEVVLASYTTLFNGQNVGRTKNIELSAAAIHNVIVGSGDIFSFNMTVGPRNKTKGYQLAPEIVNGKKVMGIGGGICQTSSTLFNAVEKMGVELVERHHHSSDVGYVPKGRDATVSFGGLDFKFQNTIGVPFLIKTYFGKSTLTVQITTSHDYAYMLRNLED